LRNTIGLIAIDKDIKIHVVQNGKPREFTLKLVDPKEMKTRAQKIYPALAGVYIDSIENFNIPHMGSISGLQLLDVVVDSPAWQQGLRPNDIIISANNKKTSNLKELEKSIADKNKPLLLQVARNNSSFFMAIKAG
jgi:S1-C subfamily serine protease